MFLISSNRNMEKDNNSNMKINFPKEYNESLIVVDPNVYTNFKKIYDFHIEDKNIKLQNALEWTDGRVDDFLKILINCKGKSEYIFENYDSWTKINNKFKKYSLNQYCLYVDIGGKKPVLIFFGCQPDGSNPGLITIISLEGDKPEVIFNSEYDLKRIVKIGKSYRLRMQSDYDEYNEDENGNAYAVNPNPFCEEVYIQNNELKVVKTKRVPEDDECVEQEQKSRTDPK